MIAWRLVYESRASTVLYRLATARDRSKPWLLPANVCPVVPWTLSKAGTPYELVDIDDESLCMAESSTLRRLADSPTRYGALLYVRTYGLDRDCSSLFRQARRLAPELLIVDDRCLCPPVLAPPATTDVDVALYSTGYAKVLDLGAGGYAFLGEEVPYVERALPFDPTHLERMKTLHRDAFAAGLPLRYEDGDWLDSRTPEVSLAEYRAAIASRLPAALEHKRELNAIYHEGLPAEICLGDGFQGWRFHVRVADRQGLLNRLFDDGLFASAHYAPLVGVLGSGDAPVAAALHAEIVNLFNDRYYTPEQARRTVDHVRAHLGD